MKRDLLNAAEGAARSRAADPSTGQGRSIEEWEYRGRAKFPCGHRKDYRGQGAVFDLQRTMRVNAEDWCPTCGVMQHIQVGSWSPSEDLVMGFTYG